jgi:hypothetical protein
MCSVAIISLCQNNRKRELRTSVWRPAGFPAIPTPLTPSADCLRIPAGDRDRNPVTSGKLAQTFPYYPQIRIVDQHLYLETPDNYQKMYWELMFISNFSTEFFPNTFHSDNYCEVGNKCKNEQSSLPTRCELLK